MPKIAYRFDLGTAIVAGVVAGTCLMGFEMVASSLSGAATADAPLRMAAALVLGRRALSADYPFAGAALAGIAVCIVLSIVFAAAFTALASWIAAITEGELLTHTADMLVAGVIFGVALWLMNFYVIAPLAGWRWFPDDMNHLVAFLGHGFFFGGVLGLALGLHRLRHAR
jgi:uncharacterized membrane protein YagU involved in acid resistance